ncbi:MAG: DUF5060 domain-containing protein [Flavobacteriales bacterium]|nr:DUF5060 domain-containing protein [Flavobacteriales bacterium]
MATALTTAIGIVALGQTTYPDVYLQNEVWSSGMRFFTVPQRIISPGNAALPLSTTEAAHTEFISATEIRLTDGFHAGGLSGDGRFRAWIDEGLGDPSDVVVISPDASQIVDGVLHVKKWEKLEIGVRLPQDYQEAIERFFDNYYPFSTDPNVSDPSNTDATHDLNPYADDSLQVVMRLTSPSGAQQLKWGFYMREAKWGADLSGPGTAQQVADETDPLDQYRIRFRMAPDEEGPWQFTVSIKAPHTSTLASAPLDDLLFTRYAFHCDPPLEDNDGPLSVNHYNRRSLWFTESQKPFFALGTNMADIRHNDGSFGGGWNTFHKRDFEVMKTTMEQLHSAGGNFVRMWLMQHLFGPERVNLGVYDAHREYAPCDDTQLTGYAGNCQYECWAFDQLLDHARANNIYIDLCIDPGFPSNSGEDFSWGNHSYVLHYIKTQERDPVTQTYDIKQFFYTPGTDPLNKGVFYYWKRKYKYIMSRWGYAVNLPIIEPFNEIDQLFTYHTQTGVTGTGLCPDNAILWSEDPDIPETLDSWLTDISGYVRGQQDLNNTVASPLGENKLFSVNFTQGEEADTPDNDHFLPFRNESVDLIDVHKGYFSVLADAGTPDIKMNDANFQARKFWEEFPQPNADDRKPISHGEFSHFTHIDLPGATNLADIEKYFHNYDVSFHNEIWSAAFSGKWAAGNTWHWERVFWWPDALKSPPPEPLDPQYTVNNPSGYTNQLTTPTVPPNVINVGGNPVPIPNRPLYHHLKPLADFLALPGIQESQFFTYNYAPVAIHDPASDIECYYLCNGEMAIGWVHNRNAWTMNNYYLASGQFQNFLGCDPPDTQPQQIAITQLLGGNDYYTHWFPTRMSTNVCPSDALDEDGDNTVFLRIDLSILCSTRRHLE